MKLRNYQEAIRERGVEIIKKDKFLYLSMEVRTGKTITALSIAESVSAESVLFLTKKKAISSIVGDHKMMGASCKITVINYESGHKFEEHEYDFIICDESHSLGAFPKASKRARLVRRLIERNKPYVILMSGTPTPESNSQMYHQVYGIPNNPFSKYSNFYKFAKDYVDIRKKMINSFFINDYSRGTDKIIEAMEPYTISYTQEEAGFKGKINEHILYMDLEDSTYKLMDRLQRDKVVEGREEVILADTPVKLMSKLHQLSSGTVKFESSNSMVLDTSKAQFIYDTFGVKKIGIFYKFTAELKALKEIYGDLLCTELEDFNGSDKSIALQIVSGREGISLKEADCLVYYNIDFSATSYWQSRDRMTTKDREVSDVYWIFSNKGIEKWIYDAVVKKKNYTLQHFKKDFLTLGV